MMRNADFSQRLAELIAICDINKRYYHILLWRWEMARRIAWILTHALTAAVVAGLALAVLFQSILSAVLCVAALFAIGIVVGIGSFKPDVAVNRHFRKWFRLSNAAEQLEYAVANTSIEVEPQFVENFSRLLMRRNAIEADESAPWRRLLRRCQEDHNESVWGDGIRTESQIRSEQARRLRARQATRSAFRGSEDCHEVVLRLEWIISQWKPPEFPQPGDPYPL